MKRVEKNAEATGGIHKFAKFFRFISEVMCNISYRSSQLELFRILPLNQFSATSSSQ